MKKRNRQQHVESVHATLSLDRQRTMEFLKGVLREGLPFPLGATWDGTGVNFAVFSRQAFSVEICFFAHPRDPVAFGRFKIPYRTGDVWHVYCPGVKPGQCYGYRVHGVDALSDPRFLLSDPYAKQLIGSVVYHPSVFKNGHGDTAPYVPKSVVVDASFDWGKDTLLRTPWEKTVLYECHVKGFTQLCPGVPEYLKGTFLGMVSDSVLQHLKTLGVTAVELLPVQMAVSEERLVHKHLTNYWGYNTLGFFAPDPRYAAVNEGPVAEQFKRMVRVFHEHGIEVILDVVYNHTAEGGEGGPVLCFKGFGNGVYYRTDPLKNNSYQDFSGCGNTLNMEHPQVFRYVMDSLRYWVQEMHVDGFRLDLATALIQPEERDYARSAFFKTIAQDPVLHGVKWIAEPWDIRPESYALGKFPADWREWNGRYRDTVRRYWRGDSMNPSEMAYAISGSDDIFDKAQRESTCSVHFVTCHDGFSLLDLVSYSEKHNTENAEDNKDGSDNNFSFNHGEEGFSHNSVVNALRFKQQCNMLMTLFLSKGVPMLRSGDEFCQTHHGNNNMYCHDNRSAWIPWENKDNALVRQTAFFSKLRFLQTLISRGMFFSEEEKDILWLCKEGRFFTENDWHEKNNTVMGFVVGLNHEGTPLLCLMNPLMQTEGFLVAQEVCEKYVWKMVFSTDERNGFDGHKAVLNEKSCIVMVPDRMVHRIKGS